MKKKQDHKVSPCAPSLGKKRKPLEDHENSVSGSGTGKAGGKQPRDAGHWLGARRLLQGAVTLSRERELAACRPADVVTSSYVSLLQVNYELHQTTARAMCAQHSSIMCCSGLIDMAMCWVWVRRRRTR